MEISESVPLVGEETVDGHVDAGQGLSISQRCIEYRFPNTSNEIANTIRFIQVLSSPRCHDANRSIKSIDDHDRQDGVSLVVLLIGLRAVC